MSRRLFAADPGGYLKAVCGLAAIASILVTAVFIKLERDRIINEAEGRNVVFAQMLEEHARGVINSANAALADLAPDIMADGRPTVSPTVAVQMKKWTVAVPQLHLFLVIGNDGQPLFSTLNTDLDKINLSDRTYFRENARGQDIYIDSMMKGRLRGLWFFAISKRLVDKAGDFQGVLLAAIRADYFSEFYGRLKISQADHVGLFKPDGTVVASRLQDRSEAASQAAHPLFADTFSGGAAGVFEDRSAADGVTRLGAYRTVQGWPLVVVAFSDKYEVLKPWIRSSLNSAIYCAVVLGFLGGTALWGSRRVKAMQQALRAREEFALRCVEGQERARALEDTLTQGVVHQDRFGRVIKMNPAAEAILGWSESRALDLTSVDFQYSTIREDGSVFPADEHPAMVALRTGRVVRNVGMGVFNPHEGTHKWLNIDAVPLFRADEDTAYEVYTVFSDVTKIREQTKALAVAKAESDRAVVAKAKFLAAASHDLRQPVQSLVLLLSSTRRAVAAMPEVLEMVDMMEAATDSLRTLLSGILDISRLDAEVIVPQMTSVDVGAIVDRVASEYVLAASNKGLTLRWVARSLRVRTDPALLERCLHNLLENALRYTWKGGILVGARQRDQQVRIDVIDTGIGIEIDKQELIFEEFYQVDNLGRNIDKGLGLGLAIVVRIAHLLGGKVEVSSQFGRGSRFSLLLGTAQDNCPAGSTVDAAPEDPGGRILVIEDNDTLRRSFELMLVKWGYEAECVSNGEDALDLAAAEDWRFDAVIADHRLGAGLTGIATCKEIQSRANRPIPVMIVTGDTAREPMTEIHGSGFLFLHKPVSGDTLRWELAGLLLKERDLVPPQ